MRYLFFFLFLCGIISAQQKPLELKIVSLEKIEDTDERKFELTYTLSNSTANKLSFFFNPDGFGGSMSNRLYYKCYQNNEYLDSGHILNSFSNKAVHIDLNQLDLEGKSEEEKVQIIKNYVREVAKIDLDTLSKQISAKELLMNLPKQRQMSETMKNLFSIEPNETKTFKLVLYWNKERYFTIDPHEYYIDENAKHEFEITLVLMKELLKDRIPEEDYAKIIADKDFIKGVFISNKFPIDFGK